MDLNHYRWFFNTIREKVTLRKLIILSNASLLHVGYIYNIWLVYLFIFYFFVHIYYVKNYLVKSFIYLFDCNTQLIYCRRFRFSSHFHIYICFCFVIIIIIIIIIIVVFKLYMQEQLSITLSRNH